MRTRFSMFPHISVISLNPSGTLNVLRIGSETILYRSKEIDKTYIHVYNDMKNISYGSFIYSTNISQISSKAKFHGFIYSQSLQDCYWKLLQDIKVEGNSQFYFHEFVKFMKILSHE